MGNGSPLNGPPLHGSPLHGSPPDGPPTLTPGQRLRAEVCLDEVGRASAWHGQLPVLLLNRCWLRLTVVPVERLALVLPPDLSRAAPELERYRALVEAGHSAWQAQQLCWLEFGAEACQQALRRFWTAQERHRGGWSLEHYLHLLNDYRERFASERPRPVPLIVLSRPSRGEQAPSAQDGHGLFWLRPGLLISERAMRHTCA